MNRALLNLSLLVAILVLPSYTRAQDWVSKMNDPSVNFFEVQKEFYKYYDLKHEEMAREAKRESRRHARLKIANAEADGEEGEVPGYAQYKRWEWFMAPRVSSTGERFDPSIVWRESQKYQQMHKSASGNWTLIGPTNSTANIAGAGRLNFIRIDPNNANNLFVGSPSGGLWKSTDAGATWSTNTDQLPYVIGCTDLAIDPTNSNIMYMATGDGDAADNYSVGLLKTTDGGLTWNTTGLSFNLALFRTISKVLIDPTNSNTILVASSSGIYKSIDAGVTFTQSQTGSFKDMEFKPNDPNTVYVSGIEFFKSVNNGTSFTKVTSGLSVGTTLNRMAITVTDADPSIVYLVAIKATTYAMDGFYTSINSGGSFAKKSTPAIGNQGFYDLALCASPGNKQEVILGGQNCVRSLDGGLTWGAYAGSIHVDHHNVAYSLTSPATVHYNTSDGGVFMTNTGGTSWNNLNHNLQIGQMYGFGQSASNAALQIHGWQDNGTNKNVGSAFSSILGGDGMMCFIDWNNDLNMWGEQFNGNLNRSTDGGNTWSAADNGIVDTGAWVTPWIQDPIDPSTIYAGFNDLWSSTDGAITWTKISTFPNMVAQINTIAVSSADNQVIWTTKGGVLFMTNNGGSTWTTVTSAPPGSITGIACSNTDANKAWITYSGFTNTSKVFETDDQGVSWSNLSASLPNIPVNCIVHVDNPNANEGLYIGTDIGVFYKDATLNVWQPFLNGLPHVQVTQLGIFYPTLKIRASTYGRGLWESDLYISGSYAPEAAFGSTAKISCPGTAVKFIDYSAGQPTSWNWTFTNGSPSTSKEQNPTVYYNTPGSFPVTLSVSNSNGSSNLTTNNFIVISPSPFNAPTTTGAKFCSTPGPTTVSLSASSSSGAGTLRWWDAPGGGNLVTTGTSFSPTLDTTKTYYVDEDFPVGVQDNVGEPNNAIGTPLPASGAYFSAKDIRGLFFNVLAPVVINTVDVYPQTAGNRTIEVLDAQGNLYVDTTLFIPASTGSVTINLNFTMYPGNDYFIKCRGQVDLWRNDNGAVYPYDNFNAPPLISITNSNAGSPGYYYFFYNWFITPITCNTSRTPVTALDTCAIIGINDISAGNSFSVYPNPNNGVFSVNFNASIKDNYQVSVTNALGEIVYKESMHAFSGQYLKKIDISEFGKGVYMINVSNSRNETVRKIMIY